MARRVSLRMPVGYTRYGIDIGLEGDDTLRNFGARVGLKLGEQRNREKTRLEYVKTETPRATFAAERFDSRGSITRMRRPSGRGTSDA